MSSLQYYIFALIFVIVPICLEGNYYNGMTLYPMAISYGYIPIILLLNEGGVKGQFLRDKRFGVYHYDVHAMRNRKVQYPVHPMILARRSLREMNGLPIPDSTLMSLFEAARWAPSYYNTQSWRFIYAKRDTPYWPKFVDALVPANQKWAQHAAALIVVLSNKYQIHKGEKKPVESHTFDTGAAWMNMALEGTARGLVVHPMSGFDKDKVRRMINLNSDDYEIEAMIAVGNRVRLVSNEKITERHELDKFVSEGIFKENIFPTQSQR